jgi:hypothetical protein
MQAITAAISPTGINYLMNGLVVDDLVSGLKGLKPPPKTIPIPNFDINIDSVENLVLHLTNGGMSGFNPVFQSISQGPNGSFTLTLAAGAFHATYNW